MEPVVFGDPELLSFPHVARCDEAEAARQAATALVQAVDATLAGETDAIVTAPLHKAALSALPGGPHLGHTGYLAFRAQGTPVMTFVGGELRLGLLTVHVPLEQVSHELIRMAPAGIAHRIRLFHDGLRRDLGVSRPRIAILGLNPHAGEDGLLGAEEAQILIPALQRLRAEGLFVDGPLPADGYFSEVAAVGPRHDGILACYHDQGLVGFKALVPRGGVQLTLGLNIIRTSCQHGTARALVGTGRVDPSSMEAAIRLAAEIVRRRDADRWVSGR